MFGFNDLLFVAIVLIQFGVENCETPADVLQGANDFVIRQVFFWIKRLKGGACLRGQLRRDPRGSATLGRASIALKQNPQLNQKKPTTVIL